MSHGLAGQQPSIIIIIACQYFKPLDELKSNILEAVNLYAVIETEKW